MLDHLRLVQSEWLVCAVVVLVSSYGAYACAEEFEISDEVLLKARDSFEEHRGKRLHFDVQEGMKPPAYVDRARPFQAGPLCGPNSLYAVCRLLDVECKYEDVLQLLPTGEMGCSLSDLHSAAIQLGLSSELRKDVTPEQLLNAPKPIIVHLESPGTGDAELESLDHFTVLTGYQSDSENFYCIDSTNCVYSTISAKAVARSMSGYCLKMSGQEFTRYGSPLGYWLAWTAVILSLGANLIWQLRYSKDSE